MMESSEIDNQTEIQEESPELIKEGLAFLLSRYMESQSQLVAKKIVTQLEKLLIYTSDIGFKQDRCAYYKLLKHWRAKCL